MRQKKLLTLFILISLLACKSSYNLNNNITYNNTIQSIIENNCITCHSGKKPRANLNLKNYDNLVDAIKNKQLLHRINDSKDPMPIDGLMSKKERLAIQQWAENGFVVGSKSNNSNSDNFNASFKAPNLQAVDITKNGFDFFEKIQGHWVGNIFLLGKKIPWFAFDFRAINTSQVHSLFEGGSMGNLFNTFFVAEYKGTKTIMLRNGGVLGGIYRTSYFVLTKVENNTYFFEDAYGGKQIMWVEVSFKNNTMKMLTHTSNLGIKKPSKHMEFVGEKMDSSLAKQAALKFNFPTKKVVHQFPNGITLPNWGSKYPTVTSASFITEDDNSSYIELGKQAQDPIQITDLENLAELTLMFNRKNIKDKKINVYLSKTPLTNNKGDFKTEYNYITQNAMDSVILFPEIDKEDEKFTLTYLHTGKCFITFVIDNNNDMIPSKGDFYTISREINLTTKPSVLKIENIDKIVR